MTQMHHDNLANTLRLVVSACSCQAAAQDHPQAPRRALHPAPAALQQDETWEIFPEARRCEKHVTHACHMHEPGPDARIWTCDVWWTAHVGAAHMCNVVLCIRLSNTRPPGPTAIAAIHLYRVAA